MCITPQKAPRLKPIIYPATQSVSPETGTTSAMASPEDIRSTTAAGTRTSTSRKSLRIDLAGSGGGSGLNVPQG
jgi:hypothetical protein